MDNSDDKSLTVNNMDKLQDEMFDENEYDSTEPDINILRERTFNKELSDLVSKIRVNESREESIEKSSPKAAKEITDDQLLRLYHRLYYKAINLDKLDKVNSDLNPFELYKESSSDEIINLIRTEMSKIELQDFSILTFNIEKNCYAAYANFIPNLHDSNIIIDSLENLYSNILSNNNGFVIDSLTIERNSFLKKRFGAENSIYFISFVNFFTDFFSGADIGRRSRFF